MEECGDWSGEVDQVVGKKFQGCWVDDGFGFSEVFRSGCGGVDE
jgi:hypothetical protein